MFKEIIENGYYIFENAVGSWEEAIRKSYVPLLKKKIVEDIYVDKVIDNVKTYGPYIVLIPNVAMPHTTEGAQGCHGTAISFMKLKEPVVFDEKDSDKNAILFFSLASVNHEQHLKNIQELMDVLMNEKYVEDLMNVNSIDELKEVVQKFEK